MSPVPSSMPFALYRYFDVGGRLLYVGITGKLSVREEAHSSRSRWMDFAASSTIQRYPTLTEARSAESAAIKTEQPLFNIKQNETLAAWERLRDYLAEIERLDLLPDRREQSPSDGAPSGTGPGDAAATGSAGTRKAVAARRLPRCDVFVMMTGDPCGGDLEILDEEFGWCRVHGERRLFVPAGCLCNKTSEGDARPVIYQTACEIHGIAQSVKRLFPSRKASGDLVG